MDERQLARFIAIGRIAVGTALTVLPGIVGRSWIGPAADDPGVKIMIRGLGIRDAALGLGTYRALASGERAEMWVAGSAASDAVDALASLLAIRHIGARRALPAIATAAGAAIVGARCAATIDGA
jgi:hypothetical protein